MNFLLILFGLFGSAAAFGSMGGDGSVTADGKVDNNGKGGGKPGKDPLPVDTGSQTDEEPVEEPVEEEPQAPVEEPTNEVPTEEPVEEEPVEEEPVDETPVEEPTNEVPTEEPTEEPVDEPVEETPVEEPTNEVPTEEPVEEEPVEEEPVEEPVEEPTNEVPTEEPEEPTGGSDDPIDITNPGQSTNSDGAETDPIVVNGTIEVVAGRTHTLDAVGDDVTAVRIISDVANGHVTVNPDGTLALVMTGETFTGSQSFRYEATHTDGSTTSHTVNMRVVQGEQAAGWATGTSHYMLETDENDNVVVEAGENHTKVYVSGSSDALSLADIARAEGMSVSEVTGEWLLANGNYGQSEGTALAEDAGMALWHAATPRGSETSNWLLFERGYTYDDLGRVLIRDTDGEDPLHPLYVGAYGSGDKPILTEEFLQNGEGSTNLVVQGLEFHGGVTFQSDGANVIFDDISVKYVEMVVMRQDGVTVRNSDFTDVHNEDPVNAEWQGSWDRAQGIFANFNNGAAARRQLLRPERLRRGLHRPERVLAAAPHDVQPQHVHR